MALSKNQIKNVEEVLRVSLRNKFQNYKPEPASMPFHTRLLGKDRLALYSFIHSLNTNFGTTIFEPVALALAKKSGKANKNVLIVDGGPGTGKSVVAVNLLVAATKLGLNARYVTKNAAPFLSFYHTKPQVRYSCHNLPSRHNPDTL